MVVSILQFLHLYQLVWIVAKITVYGLLVMLMTPKNLELAIALSSHITADPMKHLTVRCREVLTIGLQDKYRTLGKMCCGLGKEIGG